MGIEVTQADRDRLLEILALWDVGRKQEALERVASHRQSLTDVGQNSSGKFSEWSTAGLASQRRMQARDQLDPEFSQFMTAVAERLASLTDASAAVRIATSICQSVVEIPDRTSPDDQPDMMLVTADELHTIVICALENEGETGPTPMVEEPLGSMDSAPRDGRYIIAVYRSLDGYAENLHGRAFVVRHEGAAPSGYDLGWALFPGHGGVPDKCLSGWMPLPALALEAAPQ